MSDRASDLAAKFEQVNAEAIKTVEACSDQQWQAICKDEGWSVGITVHHIAGGFTPILGLIRAMAAGAQFPALTMEQIDQSNAKHAQDFANCSKEDTLAMLRRDGAAAADAVRTLSDEQLDQSAVILTGAPAMTTEQVVQEILIASAAGHLDSIRATI